MSFSQRKNKSTALSSLLYSLDTFSSLQFSSLSSFNIHHIIEPSIPNPHHSSNSNPQPLLDHYHAAILSSGQHALLRIHPLAPSLRRSGFGQGLAPPSGMNTALDVQHDLTASKQGTIGLGQNCNPSDIDSCVYGANCYALNSMLIPQCGSSQATCNHNAQCAFNTCNEGICNGSPTNGTVRLGEPCSPSLPGRQMFHSMPSTLLTSMQASVQMGPAAMLSTIWQFRFVATTRLPARVIRNVPPIIAIKANAVHVGSGPQVMPPRLRTRRLPRLTRTRPVQS